jgi:hypothetical protein
MIQSFTLTAGTTYTLSAYIHEASSTAGVILFVGVLTAGFSGTDRLTAASFTGAGLYSITFTPVANDSIAVRFGLGCTSNATGTVVHETPQLEIGPTPSSYIPTAGSAVTRAADVLTVPAANLPYPTPTVIGPELVTNGTFDTDVSGWTASFGLADISWVSGVIRVQANSTGVSARVADQVITGLTAGKVYQFSGDVVAQNGGIGTNARIEIRSGDNNTSVALVQFSSNQTGTINSSFVATGTSQVVRLRWDGNALTTDYSFDFDNISVREINPLAVSIQMDGRVTYADEGQFYNPRLYRWFAVAGTQIEATISTISTRTGDPVFRQAASGVDRFVETAAYSPDILVPFNVSSRHGSNFLNGAVDGTALTADTTVIALPDLSQTNLLLADLRYMGTIRTFRMWGQDITDAGLVEATEPSLVPSLSLTFDGTENSFIVEDWSE